MNHDTTDRALVDATRERCEGITKSVLARETALRLERDCAREQFDRHVAWAAEQAAQAEARETTLREQIADYDHDLLQRLDPCAAGSTDLYTWGKCKQAKVARQREELIALREQNERLTAVVAEARALLKPCEQESLSGAIRNLQQAHLSEKGNAEDAERVNAALRERVRALEAALRDAREELSPTGPRIACFNTAQKARDELLARIAALAPSPRQETDA